MAANLAEAASIFPRLQQAKIRHAVADRFETYVVDGIPIVDWLPGVDNVLLAEGWCGHGWAIAPAVVQELGEWIVSGSRPAVLKPFGFDRFGGPACCQSD